MTIIQTPYVEVTVPILQLRKMKLLIFSNSSEVTQLEVKSRFSNPQVRAHSSPFLILVHIYFGYASLNVLLKLLKVLLMRRDYDSLLSLRASPAPAVV